MDCNSQILTLSKSTALATNNQDIKTCQVIKFSSDFKTSEILTELLKLDPKIFPNLSIFIIEDENFEFLEKDCNRVSDIEAIKGQVHNFDSNHPFVMMQLISKSENKSKFYYRIKFKPLLAVNCESFVRWIDDELLNLLATKEENDEFCDEFHQIITKPRNFYKVIEPLALDNAKSESLEDLLMMDIEPIDFYNVSDFEDTSSYASSSLYPQHFFSYNTFQPSSNNSNLDFCGSSPKKLKTEQDKSVKIEELTQEELLEDTKDSKIVLITDKFNSCKTWALKNLAKLLRKLHPEKYITYVDYDIFISDFGATETDHDTETAEDHEIESFVSKIIAKSSNEFNAEVFNKFYKNGKVCILMDEVQQASVQFLTKLLQSFQQNGGNQLWIASEPVFGVILKETLRLDVTYKLDELVEMPRNELIEYCRKLLKIQLKENKSLEFHKKLWQDIRDYFELEEMYQIIQHVAKNQGAQGLDLTMDSTAHLSQNQSQILLTAIEHNTIEVAELTWNEIKAVLIVNEELEPKNYLATVGSDSKNILHVLMETGDPKKLQLFWNELQEPFEPPDKLAELFWQNLPEYPLHIAARGSNLEFHETLWTLMLQTFQNHKYLMNLILQKNKSNENFIHCLINNDNPEIISFTFPKIKETFNSQQVQMILQSKASNGRNLLQKAASRVKNVKTFQILWKILQETFEPGQFLDVLKEVDATSTNVFQITACFSSKKILKFIFEELEKIASKTEIQVFLSILGISRKNLLQLALTQNKSEDFHKYLWKILKKIFNPSQILDMIKHKNVNGKNLLFHAFEYSPIEVIKVTWFEIWKIFVKVDEFGLSDYLNSTNNEGENILHVLVNEKDSQSLKELWTMLKENFRFVASLQLFRDLFAQKTLLRHDNVLHIATKQDKIEFHKVFWKLLLKTFKRREELKNLMFQTNKFEDNFMTFLILCDNPEVIKYTFEKIKENFSCSQYLEILQHKGYKGRNLLQYAACTTKNIETIQTLWNIFQESSQTTDEFLEIITEVDDDDYNVIHYAACFTTTQIFNFMINKLQILSSSDDVKAILDTLGQYDKNLLQLAVRHNEDIEFHKNLWEVMRNYFIASEVVDMIRQRDTNENILMLDVVECNTKEIVEFTWNEAKKYLLDSNIQPNYIYVTDYKASDLINASKKNECYPNVNGYCQAIQLDFEKAFGTNEGKVTNCVHYKKRFVNFSPWDNIKRLRYN